MSRTHRTIRVRYNPQSIRGPWVQTDCIPYKRAGIVGQSTTSGNDIPGAPPIGAVFQPHQVAALPPDAVGRPGNVHPASQRATRRWTGQNQPPNRGGTRTRCLAGSPVAPRVETSPVGRSFVTHEGLQISSVNGWAVHGIHHPGTSPTIHQWIPAPGGRLQVQVACCSIGELRVGLNVR